MSVFVFIINYVVVFPVFCPACLQFYPNEMISWSSLKISDGARKQFQRIKKSLLPKTRKEGQCFQQAKTAPHLPRFFITGPISFVLSFVFFNFIVGLCRRRCHLQGLPLRKPMPYCNRPRSNALNNLPQPQIRLRAENHSYLATNI